MTDATPDATSDASPEHEVSLSLSADDDSLEIVHDAVSGLLDRHAVDPALAGRFETGVIEILGNIVEHAFGSDRAQGLPHSQRRLEVVVRVDGERLVAVLGDNGLPAALDLSAVTMPTDPEAESGRGLALAIAAVDDLHYERVGDRNSWSLSCRRT